MVARATLGRLNTGVGVDAGLLIMHAPKFASFLECWKL